MKKSRIIVPALAMLTLSVAASVTGTVAWFTASRTATITSNTISVMNAGGDLGVKLKEGLHTSVSGKTITNTPLMDASINANALTGDVTVASNVNVYTANINSDNQITGLAVHDGNYYRQIKSDATTTNVFGVNTWQATFSTSAVSENYLFFDTRLANSNLNNVTDGNDDSKSVFRALRVCMYTEEEKLVWAPYTLEEIVYNVNQEGGLNAPVNANDPFSAANYNGHVVATNGVIKGNTPVDIIKSGDSSTAASDNAALLSSQLSASKDITVNFALWFEGLDSNCVSSAQEISSIGHETMKTLNLSFYSVDSTTLTA